MGANLSCESLGSLHEEAVRKAVFPGLSDLQRPHEWMSFILPMLAGVAILRVVAAPDLPADEARAQVNPRVAGGDTLLAYIGSGNGIRFVTSEVVTGAGHGFMRPE